MKAVLSFVEYSWCLSVSILILRNQENVNNFGNSGTVLEIFAVLFKEHAEYLY